MNSHQILEEVSVGPQPSENDLKQLARKGVKTVINLRVENEQEGQLSPMDEGQLARDLGLEYLHIPVIGDQIREGQVDEFRNAVENLPKPIYAHCAKGKRAAALSMMTRGVRDGWSGKETVAQATQLGFEFDPNLEKFMKEYVDAREA
jgi:uncharacterized protein (TIGR01244 family)